MTHHTIRYGNDDIRIKTKLGHLQKMRVFEDTQDMSNIEQGKYQPGVIAWGIGLIPYIIEPPYDNITSIESLPDDIQVKIFDCIAEYYPLSGFFRHYITHLYGPKVLKILKDSMVEPQPTTEPEMQQQIKPKTNMSPRRRKKSREKRHTGTKP